MSVRKRVASSVSVEALQDEIAFQKQRIAELEKQLKHQPDNAALLRRIERLEANGGATLAQPEPQVVLDEYADMKARLRKSYEARKNQLRVQLRAQLYSRYEAYELNLAHRSGATLPDGTYSSTRIEDLPYSIAAELTDELPTDKQLKLRNSMRLNGSGSARLQARLEVFRECTKDLLASTELPPVPTRLRKALEQAQQPREQPRSVASPRAII